MMLSAYKAECRPRQPIGTNRPDVQALRAVLIIVNALVTAAARKSRGMVSNMGQWRID